VSHHTHPLAMTTSVKSQHRPAFASNLVTWSNHVEPYELQKRCHVAIMVDCSENNTN
jgi:hypothetical protein